ncbi:FAD-dependent oxidoreductase [Kocuria tytonis]|uniref:FAD-dependent oxidoreductase n=1 Tax=Kocuria tytonis TaxID=2054280 RepID=A0A495A4B8_9MICC|nr:FAD-dependent oxidoreductase [Kocuria tytonis]RKQ33147.1 FAD-dependent oxidoreductase [Kocuria tytonis]
MSTPEQHFPGRDRRAVRHPGPTGAPRVDGDRTAVVIGGGIAGIAAATALAERGTRVTLLESTDRLGGRVAAWPLPDGRSMSRGFHAFFRQYYNLRSLLRRVDPDLQWLTPVTDYPLLRAGRPGDSFANIPRTPPWNVLGFVLRSPAFTPRSLSRVNAKAALEMMRVRFPDTFSAYDGESAAMFLDRLRFPEDARDLALEVFARSFFASPDDFAAGELVAMFHAYFIGSAEGLIFDVPTDDYDTAIWAPLGRMLAERGVTVRCGAEVDSWEITDDQVTVCTGQDVITADAAVLATDPRSARGLVDRLRGNVQAGTVDAWKASVADTRNAPPFTVLRLWYDGLVDTERPAFVGTSGFGPVDNVSLLERFEAGAARWSAEHGGSVVELHAYACDTDVQPGSPAARDLAAQMERELHRIWPECAHLNVVERETLIRDDCTLITPENWAGRPGVETPWQHLVLAGDWVRCDYPVALMERAATTGFLAGNALLGRWGAAGQDLWTVPMRGLLAGRS